MNLHILAVGKRKSEYDPMVEEYRRRVVAPFSVTIEILEPQGVDHPETCRARESERLLRRIKSGDAVIVLDEHGRDLSTVDFSKILDRNLNDSIKRIVFVIGGAYGIDSTVIDRGGFSMRLGSMTMPHELARLVLAEQLYRATNLLSGGKYHHV